MLTISRPRGCGRVSQVRATSSGIGRALDRLMRQRGLSARALEEASRATQRINRNKIAALLADEVSPTLDEVIALAHVLKVDAAALLPFSVSVEAPWQRVALELGLSMSDALELRERARDALGARGGSREEVLQVWLRWRGLDAEAGTKQRR